RLAVRRALARAIEGCGDAEVELARDLVEAADRAVVHEQPAPVAEGMAVGAARRCAGRGADMGEERAGADLLGDALEVLVVPRGPQVAVEARLRPVRVPADAEAVALRRQHRLARVHGLLD